MLGDLEEELTAQLSHFGESALPARLCDAKREAYMSYVTLWFLLRGSSLRELDRPIPLDGTMLEPGEYRLDSFSGVCLRRLRRRPSHKQPSYCSWKDELRATSIEAEGRLLITSSRLVYSAIACELSLPFSKLRAVRRLGREAVGIYTVDALHPLSTWSTWMPSSSRPTCVSSACARWLLLEACDTLMS